MPALEGILFEALNRGIKTVLSVDPDSAAALDELKEKVFCVRLTFPRSSLFLVVESGGFSVAPNSEQQADVTLEGSIFAFARLSGKGASSRALTDGQVKMQGDAEAGQALQKIFAQFDFDWEELIAQMIGDTPARKIGNALRNTFNWASNSVELSQQNVADYLTEERQLIVSQVAMERFAEEVNRLRADTDRLEMRIERLEQGR
jgi:ubiquinone biosynthesis protein UbiJ